MNTITLLDPQSGRKVFLRHAQLPQQCSKCKMEMQGTLIVSVEDSHEGWMCLHHLERALLDCSMSNEFEMKQQARMQLRRVVPGDSVIVTRQMLAALEVS